MISSVLIRGPKIVTSFCCEKECGKQILFNAAAEPEVANELMQKNSYAYFFLDSQQKVH
jgi:hypothetical protein